MSEPFDEIDPSLDVKDVAAIEFYLRCRIVSPLKSWFKPKEIAGPVGTNAKTAGASLSSILRSGKSDLEIEKRPGGRGGARYGVRRRRIESEPRTWWIESGTRTVPPDRVKAARNREERSGERRWWIERGERTEAVA